MLSPLHSITNAIPEFSEIICNPTSGDQLLFEIIYVYFWDYS